MNNTNGLKNEKNGSIHETAFTDDIKKEKKPTTKNKKPTWITRSMAEEIGREEVLKRTLFELLIYVIFTIFATIYIIGFNSTAMYYMNKGLREQFLEHDFTTKNDESITFEKIRTAVDFWSYVEGHMINSFFWESTYGNGEAKDSDGMNILYENKVLGVPRIRMVKVRNDSCIVHEYFLRMFLDCYDEYSEEAEDKEKFGIGTATGWTYYDETVTKSLKYRGKIATYGGGGFYNDFSDTKVETQEIIKNLKDNMWITRGTRAVFVDFTVYNANLNIFGVAKLVFEFPSTGGVIPSDDIRTVNLIQFKTTWGIVVLICKVFSYIFILFYLLEEIREIMYFRGYYFLKFWNYVDLAIILLMLTGLIYSILNMVKVPSAVDTIKKNLKAYGNLEYVNYLEYNRVNILAIALCLIYLKAFKFLNFNRTMGQLNNTLNRCAWDILGFSIMFFIIFFAYAELGYLVFGHQVENFSTFSISMFTLLRTILGDFNYPEIEEANSVLAPIYFITYIFLVFFVLLNMFLAIINDTYSDVKTEIALAPDELQMTEYIGEKLAKLFRKWGSFRRFFPQKLKKEIKTTLREIREVLKKCGFTDMEIEMFFARYNIDPLTHIKIKDSEQFLQELKTILSSERNDGVRLEDFISQQEKLQQVENAIGRLVDQVRTLLYRLEMMENVIKERRR
uniref:Polycystin-2-like isoform X1 n=1 Tax=Diabrotica virgifera virgifera TaxID=50390 RepID=A0A6P7F3I7_DIAVI